MRGEDGVDKNRFDDLTKTLAGGASRRSALKALAGGAAGALAGLIGRPAAAAPPAGKGPNKSDCCPPEAPRLCGGLTCSACCADADCGAGSFCSNGTCVSGACPTPTTCTNSSTISYCDEAQTCVCVQTTEGSTACINPAGITCSEPGGAPVCTSSADCGPGTVCVVDICCGETKSICIAVCSESPA